MEYVIGLVVISMLVGWWYYDNSLKAATRKILENQAKVDAVKAIKADTNVVVAKMQEEVKVDDVKEVKAGVNVVIAKMQEEVKKRATRKKKTNNG